MSNNTGILGLIGNTPMLKLEEYCKDYDLRGNIYVKLDGFNPFGSSKDRVALQLILDAEKKGKLTSGSTIIEPTSGNTGIGLAAIAALKKYKMIIVMPSNMSVERIKTMKAYGAEVILTDAKLGMSGSIKEAKRLLKETPNSFMPDQFKNKSNSKAHYLTTGPEIYKQMKKDLSVFIAGIGTGGTITGTAKYLKKKDPSIKIVGFEPASSPFLTEGHGGAHQIAGIGAGFKPSVLEEKYVDSIVTVTDEEALSKTKELATKYSLFVGVSSAASIVVATKLAKLEEYKGKNIVAFSPDNGIKYLSLPIFE